MAGYASDRCIRRPRAEGRASTRSRTVQSRCIDTLAADAPAALAAIASARAARARTWTFAGDRAPDHDPDATAPLVIDVDATLVTAHSEKESAAPTFKRGFGFHPLWAFVDHGPEGTGEPLAFGLRDGNAGSNPAGPAARSQADPTGALDAGVRDGSGLQGPEQLPGAGERQPGRRDPGAGDDDRVQPLVLRVGTTLAEARPQAVVGELGLERLRSRAGITPATGTTLLTADRSPTNPPPREAP
jgi:Transposase DDE domain group 1